MGQSLTALTKADSASDADSVLEHWIKTIKAIVLPRSVEAFLKETGNGNAEAPINTLHWLSNYEGSTSALPKRPEGSLCLFNKELAGSKASKSIRSVVFKAPADYESGDHLTVVPVNSDSMVSRFLHCFLTDIKATVPIYSNTIKWPPRVMSSALRF